MLNHDFSKRIQKRYREAGYVETIHRRLDGTADKFCQICSYPIEKMAFPMRGNICFECEVIYNHDIAVTRQGAILMRRKRDWLRTARGSGHYPLTFNFVLQKNTKYVQCSYCGNWIKEKEITKDHVWPKSKGGIIKTPACGPCNDMKEDMKPIEFAVWFSKEHGIAMLPIGSDDE